MEKLCFETGKRTNKKYVNKFYWINKARGKFYSFIITQQCFTIFFFIFNVNYKFFQESSNLIYTTFSLVSLASPPPQVLRQRKKHSHIAANYISVSRLLLKLMIIHFYCSLTISFRSTQQDTISLHFGMLREFMLLPTVVIIFHSTFERGKEELWQKECYYKTKFEVLFYVQLSFFILRGRATESEKILKDKWYAEWTRS